MGEMMDGWMDGWEENGWMDWGGVDGRKKGWMVGDRQAVDGWMGGRRWVVDGWKEGRKDEGIHESVVPRCTPRRKPVQSSVLYCARLIHLSRSTAQLL
jgi:hypothetical protein